LYTALAEFARFRASAGDPVGADETLAEVEALLDPAWPAALRHPLLTARSFVFTESHRVAEARKAWEERLALERALGDTQFATTSLTNLIDALLAEGQAQEAIARGRELVALIRREGFANWESFALANLSAALTSVDQLDEALQLALEALPLLGRQGSVWSFLDHFGLLAFKRGHPEAAARVLGCADALNRSAGYVRQFNEFRARNELLDRLTAHFDPVALSRLIDEGSLLSADQAARAALEP
jgi:tetratricopeptide (TPR) repeat protein